MAELVAWRVARSLPNEHGFWVMLCAAILSAELRSGFTAVAIISGATVFASAVVVGSLLHRKIRSRDSAQLGASACLGLASVPIETAAGLPRSSVLAGSAALVAIFLASSFLVRSAFARSARNPRLSAVAWQRAALLVLAAAFVPLLLSGKMVEARACAMAAVICIILAWRKPTAKQLKPLGLALAALALGTAVALAL